MKRCNVKKCKAICCGVVPILNDLLHECANLIQREITLQIAVDENNTIAADRNAVCVFLTQEHRCAIYDRRPQICRIFGTGDHPLLQCRYIKK